MTTTLKRLLPLFATSLMLAPYSAAPASAGMLTGWWGGRWQCSIDGRPAQMQWDIAGANNHPRWKGWFSDNGSQWVRLRDPRMDGRYGMIFYHADGNQWYLPRPADNRSDGYTTWNGQRYRLSCWR